MKETQSSKLNTNGLLPRPPIVVILGHVDHGKTTLLDYIRKTSVVSREAGGITQSIGAYEIAHTPISINQSDQHKSVAHKITFIDTPGHEAFSKMRARGANVADLAVLVVAADDGVKPQTKEVIDVLKETKTPFIVAINKIDKNNANIEGTKQDLMKNEVFLEGAGGNISWQEISAKTGEGVDKLLDLILLTAEFEELTYNPESPAKGVIIEAKMDSRRGFTVMGVLRDGILKSGDKIKTTTAIGKIKILENFLGEKVSELSPSSPVLILGFENLPQIGEEFVSSHEGGEILSTENAEEISVAEKVEMEIQPADKNKKINLILKADVSGSLEALSGIIKTMPDTNIISESVGEITDGDVKSAQNTSAVIIGFKSRINKAVENMARVQNIEIINSEIIYEVIKTLEEKIQSLKTPPPLAELTVLAIFSQKGKKQLVGGKVDSGTLKMNSPVKIFRGEEELGRGKISDLHRGKQDATQINAGEECGVMIESDLQIAVGDRLIHQS